MPGMNSIPKRAGFLRARRDGEKAVAKGIVVQAVANGEAGSRMGITASKKIGNAVARNRARRRLRALANDVLAPVARPGMDYVLIARFDTAARPWNLLGEDLTKTIGYLHRKVGTPNQPGSAT